MPADQPDLFSALQQHVDTVTNAARSLERTEPLVAQGDSLDVCPCCHRPFLSDEGKVGRRHPGTSHDAAKMPGKKSQAVALLRLLATQGAMNVGTAAARMSKSPNQMATRMLELREAGLVERVTDPATGHPVQAPTPMGGQGEVHQATDAGIRYLRNIASMR